MNKLNWDNKEHRKLLEDIVTKEFEEFDVLRSGNRKPIWYNGDHFGIHGSAGWISGDHFAIECSGWSFIARWPDDGRKHFQPVSVRCPSGLWFRIESNPHAYYDEGVLYNFFRKALADLKLLPKLQRNLGLPKPRGDAYWELKGEFESSD